MTFTLLASTHARWRAVNGPHLVAGATPVVLGGDCSILIGIALALHRRGHHGLAFLDGHLDYRHPANSDIVGAAAGEDLALVTGLGGPLAELDGTRPYIRPANTVAIGFRPDDDAIAEASTAGMHLIDAPPPAGMSQPPPSVP
jgi:arginase